MKLRANREQLSEALTAICSVAAGRTTKDVLKCVHIDVQADAMLLSATDLEQSLRCAVTQVEVEQPGKTVVLADTLARIVRECSDEVLELETDERQLQIRGKGSHFQIVVQDVSEFPAISELDGQPDYVIEGGTLRRLIEWTVLAAARESTRYAIHGVLWEAKKESLQLAATDGRRLAISRGSLIDPVAEDVPSIIVPVKALSVFSRLAIDGASRVSVKSSGNQLLLSAEGYLLGTALVEGHFPNYQDVIPKDCDRTAVLNTSEFLAALKQAALLTNEESKGVRLSFSEGNLTISSRAPEQGEATISIPIRYDSEAVDIGFNPVFLLDILRVVHTDELTLSVREENRPGLIKLDEDFVYVVMPVNLSSA